MRVRYDVVVAGAGSAGSAATLAVVTDTVPQPVSGDTLREHLALDGALLEPVELTAGEEPTR